MTKKLITVWIAITLLSLLLTGCNRYSNSFQPNNKLLGGANIRRTAQPYRYSNEVVILTFHDISSGKSPYTISPALFNTEIYDLLSNGYTIIPLKQAVDFALGKAKVPPKAVVITTDDGYESMYTNVYPVLKKYRVPATFFLIAGLVGHHSNLLTWEQARDMQRSGLVTLGAHTYHAHNTAPAGADTLEPLTIAHIYNPQTGHTESSAEYAKRMKTDSEQAQAVFLKELGHITPYFAYPFGAFTPELDKVLKTAGYRYFFTEMPGVITKGNFYSHFFRVDIGLSKIPAVQMINKIHEWSLRKTGFNRKRNIVRWGVNLPYRQIRTFSAA